MDLWETALGFMDSQVLLTAEALGVFRELAAGPRTAEELAAAVDLPEDSARRMLDLLTALTILRKEGGRYSNGGDAESQLVPGRPGYIGAMFPHLRRAVYPIWGHFEQALREGRAPWDAAFPEGTPPNEGMYQNPEALRAFMEGMHGITYRAAADFASAPELERVDHLTDIGGASGAFLIALAERHAQLRGRVLDLPPVRPIAEQQIAQAGLTDRLEFYPADFWEDPLPDGTDGYSLGFILHDWDEIGGSILLDKISARLRPGGLLIVGEYLLEPDRTAPRWVVRADLNMLASARGRERTADEYGEWFGRHGLQLERIHRTSGSKAFLLARRRHG